MDRGMQSEVHLLTVGEDTALFGAGREDWMRVSLPRDAWDVLGGPQRIRVRLEVIS